MIAVVIPALDEADNVGDVVDGLRDERADLVIVVDNGSTDSTADVAQRHGATVVTEPIAGYGRACAAGTAHAVREGADVVVYIDGDQSSRPDELRLLLDPIARGDADLVLGSRALGTMEVGAMGPHQRFGNWLTARIMRTLYDVSVTDLGPYRAIRTELLTSLDMTEMTFGWPTEMMVKAARQEARIVEVPVTWQVRHAGDSKVSGTIKGTVLAAWYLLSVTIKHAGRPTLSNLRERIGRGVS